MSSSKARTTVTSSPRRLNAGSSSSWLQHSLPMVLDRMEDGGRRREGFLLAVEFLYADDSGREAFLSVLRYMSVCLI